MVARRNSHDDAILANLKDLIVSASDLEDSNGLKTFKLEIDPTPKPLGERRRLDQWSPACNASDPLLSSNNIRQARQGSRLSLSCQAACPHIAASQSQDLNM